MAEVLNTKPRDLHGTRNTRRLRRQGLVPAVLYGHGQEVVSLAVAHEELDAAMRHGSRLVELRGAANDTALIREIQWDPLGTDVLHLDFARVSADERIEVTVPVELRGEAPGVKDGGIVQQPIHEVKIECPAIAIPEKLQISVNALKVGDELLVKDLKLPEGVTMLTDLEEVLVHCVIPSEEDESAGAAEGAEPELIGRKASDEEGEEDE